MEVAEVTKSGTEERQRKQQGPAGFYIAVGLVKTKPSEVNDSIIHLSREGALLSGGCLRADPRRCTCHSKTSTMSGVGVDAGRELDRCGKVHRSP